MEWALDQSAGYWDAVKLYFTFNTALLLNPGMIALLVLQVFLLGCSAFFSGSETALFSLSRLDLQKLRRDRHPRSETLHALLDQPRRLIISILCGNELVNIAATANLAGILVVLYGEQRAGWINVLVMFPLLLLLGEVTPKTIAVSQPVRISAGLVAGPIGVWARLITPLRRVVRLAADLITTWIVGEERSRENILQVDEFRTLLAEVADEGILDATERVLIDNLLEAGETEIVEIMTPRTRVNFLRDDMSVLEVVDHFRGYRHPRVPVCHEHHDNLVGFVHSEDVLRLVLDGADLSKLTLDEVLHPPVIVPPTKYVDEMFDFFQANNVRAAAVLNEFGGMEGFITMRDIVSFIFGEVSEAITGQELYEERYKNVFEVPGEMKLTDFDDLTNFGIEDPRMTTIGGVVFRYLDRLPEVGDQVVMDGLVATVLEMDGHRLARVRIAKGAPGEEVDVDERDREQDPEPLPKIAHLEKVDARPRTAELETAGCDENAQNRSGREPGAGPTARTSAEVVELTAVKVVGPTRAKPQRPDRKGSPGTHDSRRG
ncbi:MAG: HlyC/CorC family transporter [Inquilinus sp.]|nr:HlyC/CorC family transporter [Inquilinus sp.]